jgi:UDP-glucose 6-dehydrogenase
MEAVLYRIKHLFGGKRLEKDISLFFRHASKKEQKKLLLSVVDKANKDQKELVESNKAS